MSEETNDDITVPLNSDDVQLNSDAEQDPTQEYVIPSRYIGKEDFRTDPDLPANLEDDVEILRKWADRLIVRYKSYVIDADDLYQSLCQMYLEAIQKYPKKDRKGMKIRPFVFNYIKFMLLSMYRFQFKFENRSIAPHDEVISLNWIDENSLIHGSENPYDAMVNNAGLCKVLAKYDAEDRLIIYNRFILNRSVQDLTSLLGGHPVAYGRIATLKKKLQNDPDMKQLLADSLKS